MARASEKTQRNTSILTIVNQMNAVCPHMGLHVRWCFQSEDQKKVRKTKVIDKEALPNTDAEIGCKYARMFTALHMHKRI